jgi:hypothetical protein
MGLEREDDEVLGAGLRHAVGRLQVAGDRFAAVLPDQLEAVLLDRGQMGALVDDRDLFAGQGKPGGHQATDRPGADHADLHGFLLVVWIRHMVPLGRPSEPPGVVARRL